MAIINFEGQRHEFPDDFSDEDIALALSEEQVQVSPLGDKDAPIVSDVTIRDSQAPSPLRGTGVYDEEVTPEVKKPKAKPSEPFREQAIIKKDEGVRRDKEGNHIAYKDSEGVMTGGRGHQLTKEEKKLYPEGTTIPNKVVQDWFTIDMKEADDDITELLELHKVHVPDEVFDILHNMTFNLGKKGMAKFNKMWVAIELGDWSTAAKEMKDSKWFGQVKNRAVRLVDRMEALAKAEEPQPAEEQA